MTDNVIPLRPAAGTTPRDLEAARCVLRAADGWTVEGLPGDAPWIAAAGPDGATLAIGREGGGFFAAPDLGERAGWTGLRTAGDAARVVAGAVRRA
jgi:hypothetical protein